MWPPVIAGPPFLIWGLPPVVWGIVICSLIIALLILATFILCCCLVPQKRKFLSPARYCTSPVVHQSETMNKPWGQSAVIVGLVPPQYSAPPAPPLGQTTNNNGIDYPPSPGCDSSISPNSSRFNIPETHKSMWAINPFCTSNTVLNENDSAFKSRSLPSWGKSKPISINDNFEELYAKINFSKKRRNRMRNDEAAIIALCRSRSQNLPGLALEREGIVIYDERTAL